MAEIDRSETDAALADAVNRLAASNIMQAEAWENFQRFIFRTAVQAMAAFFLTMLIFGFLVTHRLDYVIDGANSAVHGISRELNATEERILRGVNMEQNVHIERARTKDDEIHEELKRLQKEGVIK